MQQVLLPRLWYTIQEAAEALRMSTGAIYKLTKRGTMESRRIGRKLLIPAHVVEGRAARENTDDPPEQAPAEPQKRSRGRPRKPSKYDPDLDQ